MSNIRHMDATGLKRMLSEEKGAFIAIFSTEWCGYCRSLMNDITKSAFDFMIVEVDISSDDDKAWDEYDIGTVPTVILFKDGAEVDRMPPRGDGLRLRDIKDLLLKNHVM